MSKSLRVVVYFLGAAFILGLVTWRFNVLEIEKNTKYANFPAFFNEFGKPISTIEIKRDKLDLYRKVSAIKKSNDTLIAKVTKKDQSLLKVGNEVFSADSKTTIGSVISVANDINIEDGLYNITIRLSSNSFNYNKNLIPVTIRYKRLENILKVPIRSIIPKKNEYFVWKVINEKAQINKVILNNYNQQFIEITSGISEGDKVLVNGHRTITPNEKTIIVNQK